MRAQKLTLAAVALVAGLSLTACQSNGDAAAGPSDPASSAGSAAKAESAGDDSTGTQAGEGSGGGQITAGLCKTADLEFRTSHGMGEGDLIVAMKNTGTDACSLKGFPGVDLKTDGDEDSISAERSELTAPPVAVNRGEETRFTLHYPRNETGGSGLKITSIVVTPPEETHSKTLPVSINLPVTAGSGEAVSVDPVGSGK